MKTYTREERERIIEHVLDNDLTFFDDMFELAEGSRLLEQCANCLKYFIPSDMHKSDLDEELPSCRVCVEETEGADLYDDAVDLTYKKR
jgi:hypothetical protein